MLLEIGQNATLGDVRLHAAAHYVYLAIFFIKKYVDDYTHAFEGNIINFPKIIEKCN